MSVAAFRKGGKRIPPRTPEPVTPHQSLSPVVHQSLPRSTVLYAAARSRENVRPAASPEGCAWLVKRLGTENQQLEPTKPTKSH